MVSVGGSIPPMGTNRIKIMTNTEFIKTILSVSGFTEIEVKTQRTDVVEYIVKATPPNEPFIEISSGVGFRATLANVIYFIYDTNDIGYLIYDRESSNEV